MPGHDWSVTAGLSTPEVLEDQQRHNLDGYLFITQNVLPRLLESGVSQDDIDRLMVENPRRFFEGE